MSDNPFYRLAPFIKEFIYKNRWDTLREAQVDACRVLFDTPHHLLIAGRPCTASFEFSSAHRTTAASTVAGANG